MHAAFYDREDFDEDISCWDTSKVVAFNADGASYGMFRKAESFNQPIGCWDVGSATYLSLMFYGATKFNQNLSKWDPNLKDSIPCNFADGAACGPTCGVSWYKDCA